MNNAELSELIGKTLVEVRNLNDIELVFHCNDGVMYVMGHEQSCCEEVYIEDIVGDLDDLVGSPILMAEEATSHQNPKSESHDCFQWTFYKFATANGYVTMRWYGKSNGSYSVDVDFNKVES